MVLDFCIYTVHPKLHLIKLAVSGPLKQLVNYS